LIAPLSLTALLVDDDEATGREYKTALENIDMGLRHFPNNEEAIKALGDMAQLRLPLHILMTDIMRPNGPDGLKFIEHIRKANYTRTVGGGLRLQYLPLVVISDHVSVYKEHVKNIDAAIPVLEKPIWGDRLVEIIVDELGAYRAKILSELQHLGIAVEWKDSRFQVLPAYGTKAATTLIETDRFVGTYSTFSQSYTTLCLLNDQGAVARFFLNQFERLLNSPHVNETDMQAFFERHPEFILRGQFDNYWSRTHLPLDGAESLKPDFILQPSGLRTTPWNWEVLDLKSPHAALMPKSKFHRTFSHHVTKVVAQLKDYGEYFADPRNKEIIRKRFGGVTLAPKLVALIGRLPNEDARDRYTTLRTRLTDVSITTYDEILEFRRARVQQIESLLSRGTYGA